MTAMAGLLQRHHAAANGLYLDLVDTLTPELLRTRIPGVRSSPVRNHFWCVVGARESYLRAARAGSWQGFASSLDADDDPGAVRAALERTAAEVATWLGELSPDDEHGAEWALHLIEHETQHHGQLVRYFYAVPLTIPRSWVDHYALEEA
jgi:uncharacterized damage-inducible protein DinB